MPWTPDLSASDYEAVNAAAGYLQPAAETAARLRSAVTALERSLKGAGSCFSLYASLAVAGQSDPILANNCARSAIDVMAAIGGLAASMEAVEALLADASPSLAGAAAAAQYPPPPAPPVEPEPEP